MGKGTDVDGRKRSDMRRPIDAVIGCGGGGGGGGGVVERTVACIIGEDLARMPGCDELKAGVRGKGAANIARHTNGLGCHGDLARIGQERPQ
jgi:hypothetical protein